MPATEQAQVADEIEVEEAEELFTKATVDSLLEEQRQAFKRRINIALKDQRTRILKECAEATRELLGRTQ